MSVGVEDSPPLQGVGEQKVEATVVATSVGAEPLSPPPHGDNRKGLAKEDDSGAVLEAPSPPPQQDDEFHPYHYPAQTDYPADMTMNVPAPCCCYKRKIGKMYVCCETEEGKPLWLWGACWPMTFVTWAIVAIPVIVIAAIVIHRLSGVWVVLAYVATSVILGVFSTALFITGFKNPGIFKREREQREGYTWHEQTKSFRPRGVVFCSESQVLVKNIDHFCPWSGTVIADGNLMPFSIFTTMVCVALMYIPVLFIVLVVSNTKR